MNCLRSLGRWDRGFKSHSRHGHLVVLCVHSVFVLSYVCLGKDLATGWSLTQRVRPPMKNDYGTEWAGRAIKKKDGWRVRLTNLRHLWADCLDALGPLTSHTPMRLHGLLQGQFYLFMRQNYSDIKFKRNVRKKKALERIWRIKKDKIKIKPRKV
jgi:hypothetical protein